MSDLLTSLIFGKQPEQFLTLLNKMREFLMKKPIYKILKNKILDFFSQNLLSKSLIHSFIMSNLSESLTVAHLS